MGWNIDMWSDIKQKILKLEKLDQGRAIFGARSHQYRFHPVASLGAVRECEARLGVSLPDELRLFYMQLSNGGVAPNYGLRSLEGLRDYFKPHLEFPGAEYYRELARQEGYFCEDDDDDELDDDEKDYFEIPHDYVQGLIAIIEEGCGHQTCLITSGENIGNVVYVSNDGCITETNKKLTDLYQNWVDGAIQAFERVISFIDTDLSMEEIKQETRHELRGYSVDSLIVSLIGAQKPRELFFKGGLRFGGHAQGLWYEEKLHNYRRRKKLVNHQSSD
ncbi:MAG: SMI1/KNR4 family protein [Spirulina sp. SIO3F2]|nr:SMI1/KNR4 family protein [Spirulina sp. SIO3F2]